MIFLYYKSAATTENQLSGLCCCFARLIAPVQPRALILLFWVTVKYKGGVMEWQELTMFA